MSAVLALWQAPAGAQTAPLDDSPAEPSPRRGLRWNANDPSHDVGPDRAEPPARHGEEHPFAYTLDPSTPLQGELALEYFAQGASGVSAMRPLAANLGAQGVIHGLSVRYGATNTIAPFVSGLMLQPVDAQGGTAQATAQAGLQWQWTEPGGAFRAGTQVAVMREFAGDIGAFTRVAASYDLGPLRLAGNAHFERAFAQGRDGLDVLALFGASVKASETMRVGAEYVGQDLEDAVEKDEAEGGARHFAAAVAAVRLADGAVWLTGGPAFGLNKQSPDLMGRLTVAALF